MVMVRSAPELDRFLYRWLWSWLVFVLTVTVMFGTVNLTRCVPAQLKALPQATLTEVKPGFLLEPDE